MYGLKSLLTYHLIFYYAFIVKGNGQMKKFHRNLNIMSIFTALLLVFVLIFWRTFLNIAITNVFLNGIIIGTTVFGIGLCFVSIFRLLPEYKWMHAYFDGRANYGFVPRLLRPISSALHNRHIQLSASNLTELLDLVSIRIGTKSQQALKKQREEMKTENIQKSRKRRFAEKQRKFELKQKKHKEKHRGH